MAWRTIGECLEAALIERLEMDLEKGRSGEAPASYRVPPTGQTCVDRGIFTAAKASTPHARAVDIPVFTVIEGGRQERGVSAPVDLTRLGGGGTRRGFLKLVHSAAT